MYELNPYELFPGDPINQNLCRYGIGLFDINNSGVLEVQRVDEVGKLWLDKNGEYLLDDRKAFALCELLAEDGNVFAAQALQLRLDTQPVLLA